MAQTHVSSSICSTDRSELEKALVSVKKLGFSGVKDKTYKHPAWLAAWRDDGPSLAYPMDYSLLFDEPDEEAAQDVEHASRYQP
jgi:hypothetical protein